MEREAHACGVVVLVPNRATWHYAIDDYGDRAYRKVIGLEPVRQSAA
ncbi:hypothetical protein ABT186_13450 [Streptomyces sp. NPDC001634]